MNTSWQNCNRTCLLKTGSKTYSNEVETTPTLIKRPESCQLCYDICSCFIKVKVFELLKRSWHILVSKIPQQKPCNETKEMSRGRRKRPSIVLGHMERTPSRAWNEELALQNFHPATSSDQAFERCANKSSMTWYLKWDEDVSIAISDFKAPSSWLQTEQVSQIQTSTPDSVWKAKSSWQQNSCEERKWRRWIFTPSPG